MLEQRSFLRNTGFEMVLRWSIIGFLNQSLTSDILSDYKWRIIRIRILLIIRKTFLRANLLRKEKKIQIGTKIIILLLLQQPNQFILLERKVFDRH